MSLPRCSPLYSRLVRLYPSAYRREYQDQMLQTLADMLDGAPTRPARTSIWLRAIAGLPAILSASYTILLPRGSA